MITSAAGGIFGRGPGLGSPGFVPAIHTDFIFTAVLEEHGLLAGLALIGLWAVWLSRALKGVVRQRDPFSALINAGLAFSLGVQAAVIIGGNLRVLPLVGVTLPFTSYGGSSLLISVLSVGIILLLSNDGDPSERFGLPLRHLNLGIMVVFGITGVFLGWWVLVRGPDLIARGDNPRPAIDSRFSSRGSIYDRDLQILVETVGSPGGFERVYPEPSMATIVGYDQFPYGQTGLEGSLDGILRGDLQQNGWVTAWSYLTRNLSPPGSDIRLTLDLQSQRIAVDLLSGRRGAVVLMDADTGDLLVAASSPSYDPNTLAQDWSQLINDPASPLINRPFQGQYQPGTVLGPLMIAWELENQRITLDTQVETLDEAVLVNGASLECASLPGAIRQPVFGDVLKYACPAPLQSLMMEGGVPAYEGMIGAFHLTQQADIEPPSEMPPALPQIAEGELAMAAVGQSGLTLTPLQIVRAFTPIITDGTMPLVRWVDALRPSGGEWEQFETPSHPIQVLNGAVSAEIRGELSLGSFVAYQAQAVGGEPIGWFLGGYRGLTGNYAVVVVLEGQASSDAAEIGMVMLENVRVTSIP